jgi:hypothetical protein
MGRFHDLTRLRFLRDFEDRRADHQTPALAGDGDAFNQQIGATRRPGELDAEIAAGGLPALAKHDRDLAAGPGAPCVTGDAIGYTDNRLGQGEKGAAFDRRTSNSEQMSHYLYTDNQPI